MMNGAHTSYIKNYTISEKGDKKKKEKEKEALVYLY